MMYVAALYYLVFSYFATLSSIAAVSALVQAGPGGVYGIVRGVTGLSMFWQCILLQAMT